jgi:8-oxo-dGTP diphosphatase
MAVNGAVRAAGGVISRRNERGEVEVLLVYRGGNRRDWSFPKGKVEPGEADEACALREVREETSLRCTLGDELPPVAYHDRRGRPKVVRYWSMRIIKGDARPSNEVGAVRWLTVESALSLLTYPRDRELLSAFASLLASLPAS